MTLPQIHQAELVALAELAGVTAVPNIFRIILELLALQISPEDVYNLLKDICRSSNKEPVSSDKGHSSSALTKDK